MTLPVEHYGKYLSFTKFPGVEMLRKRTVSRWNFSMMEKSLMELFITIDLL